MIILKHVSRISIYIPAVLLLHYALSISNAQRQIENSNNQIPENSLAYRVNLNVLREGDVPLRFTNDLKNPSSPAFLRIADKAERGMNAVFCRDTRSCNPHYIGCQVFGITQALSSDCNIQIVFTLYWKPGYQAGVMGLTKELYNSLASNNGNLGTSDLFVGPIESISKSYTYAMPIMKVKGQDVIYSNKYKNTKSQEYYLVVVEFENSMDSMFRESNSFTNSYLACTVDDIDPLPFLQKGIMVTYTIYLLQNYTKGPDQVSNFIKQGFTNSPNGCLPQAQICTLPTNNEIELQMNVVRKDFTKLAYKPQYRDPTTREYNEMKKLFETGLRQTLNASPLRSYYLSSGFMEISDSQPFHLGLLFKYRITLRPQYKGDEQRVASDISRTINVWGNNCMGNTGLCIDKVPGDCSMGHPETCDRSSVCTIDVKRKRTSCACASGFVRTSALGPCFPSTCDSSCSGPSLTCAFNAASAKMECTCASGYRRPRPDGPCTPADCDLGSNAGCFAGQRCVHIPSPSPGRITCQCQNGVIQRAGGPCLPLSCDPTNNQGCASPYEVCQPASSYNGNRPKCVCAPGYYIPKIQGSNARSKWHRNKKGVLEVASNKCIPGPCDPNTNNGCTGPNEICTFGQGKIYCACGFGFIRTSAEESCTRNLCDPRTNKGCDNSEICTYQNGQYQCSCKGGYFKGLNGGGGSCLPEPCNPRENTGCSSTNEACISDEFGIRCACKVGFDKPRGSTRCVPASCKEDGSDCGNNQECALSSNGNNLECRCLSGFYDIGGGQCVRSQCDPNTHQGCRQNEQCVISPQSRLPTCQCLSQYYRIGDQCIQGSCNPNDNSGCKDNEICRVDQDNDKNFKFENSIGPYCTCARGFIRTDGRSDCVAAECDPSHNKHIGANNGCQDNEQCLLVRNAYKCQCKSGHVRIRENGVCYPASCEPATNQGCPKPEICALVGTTIKCICPYNYRKAGLDQACIYAPCDPVTNEGCPVNEICKIFPNEIKCVCSRGHLRDSEERCIKEHTTEVPTDVITKCRAGDQDLIRCGPNSECILINGVPICRCLPGFIKDNNGQCVGQWTGVPQVTATSYIVTTGITVTSSTIDHPEITPIIVPPIIIPPSPLPRNITCEDINCGPNQLCVVNNNTTAECVCNFGFDRTWNGTCIANNTGGIYAPIEGDITCDDEYCTYHGHCRINPDTGIRYCECERWWIGKQCQHNGKLIAILAPLLLGLLLLLCCLFPLCWCFGRKRKRRMAENIRVGQDGKGWDEGKIPPYTIPRPLVSPVPRVDEQALIRDGSLTGFPETSIEENSFDKRAQREREAFRSQEMTVHARPEETTEITEETTTEEWKRTYKKPSQKKYYVPSQTERYLEETPKFEGRRSTTPIRTSRKTRTEDVEEEESAEYTTEARNVETDNENDVYVGKRHWIRGNGENVRAHSQQTQGNVNDWQQGNPDASSYNYDYSQKPWVREKKGTDNYGYRNEDADRN